MRVLVVNPNTTPSMTAKIGAAARLAASPGTEVAAVNPAAGPASIEGPYDEALCLPGLLEEVARGEAEGFDAFVIACFDDPGLDAARSIASGPVVGIAEAAMHAASFVASGFTIVTTLPRAIPVLDSLALRYGFERKLRRVRAGGFAVLALEEPGSPARALLESQIARAVAEEAPEAIILGCAGMADLARELTASFGLPVIDGVGAAVRLAEALVGLGLGTSRAGLYATPLPKPYAGALARFAPR